MAGLSVIFACILGFLLRAADGGSVQLPVYSQPKTIEKFLYQDNLPALSALTTCFWVNFNGDDDNFSSDYFISLATPAEDNELLIGFSSEGKFVVYFGGPIRTMMENTQDIFSEWHRHCITVRSDGTAKWYADVTTPGVMEFMASINLQAHTIPSGGVIVLMQDQDAFFDSFSASQTMPGKLAGFNLWDYEMTALQVMVLRCRDEGNVVNWNTLKEQGQAAYYPHSFPCQDESTLGSCVLPYYPQTLTTSNYLYQTGLPAMTESTICFWLSTPGEDDDNRYEDYLVSISSSADDNMFIIGWNQAQTIRLYANGQATYMSSTKAEMDSLWIGWHKHCFTWQDGGYFKYYADSNPSYPGKLQLIKSAALTSSVGGMISGGYLIVLQEQDSHGGSLNSAQTVVGDLAWFNMWDYQMTASELGLLTCHDHGNIVNMNTLQQQGTVDMLYKTFDEDFITDPELEVLDKNYHSYKKQDMTMCRISGVSLGNHVISTQTVYSAARCVMLCTSNKSCRSLNYIKSTRECALNDEVDLGYEADLNTSLGSDYLHYTTRECSDYSSANPGKIV